MDGSTPQDALDTCRNVRDLEALVQGGLDRAFYDYYAGGANDELTLRLNQSAFDHLLFRPRVLVDVSSIDLSTTVLGTPISLPVLLAPTAFQRLAHPDGELASARGAGAAGTLMVVSTIATSTLEEIAEAAAGPLWFQLYVYRDREITRTLLDRAKASGYRAICITVDTPRLGRRERDLRNSFTLPPGLSVRNFEAIAEAAVAGITTSTMTAYVHQQLDSSLTWKTIDWIASQTSLPIVLKGILHPADASRAITAGARAIVVSNHGGRQLDGALPTIRALPAIVEAVGDRGEVYLDGGIRRGSDILKSLALGARAVLIGRPYLWGLAAAGDAGVRWVLEMLRQELELAMALSGSPSLKEIDRTMIVQD